MSRRTSHFMENHSNRPYGVGYDDTLLTCLLHTILPATHVIASPLTLETASSACHSAGCGPTWGEQESRQQRLASRCRNPQAGRRTNEPF